MKLGLPVLKVLRLEDINQGRSGILSILMGGGVVVLWITMQRGGYVGIRSWTIG